MNSNYNLRAKIVLTLLKVQDGKSLSNLLNSELNKLDQKDKGLFHELVLGTLRQWYSLKALALPLLKKPINNNVVETTLYIGLYQTLCTNVASHAAISETVTAVKQLGYEPLSGVINAILRKSVNEKESFQQHLFDHHGLPSWLAKRLKRDWPESYIQLYTALKQTAPLTLRVNQRKIDRNTYLKKLVDQEIFAEECQFSKQAIRIQQSVTISELPYFEEGYFSVQDEHAQLCGELDLELDNQNVVDACAAPGGKTGHLIEKYNVKNLWALDKDAQRLSKVKENLERLNLLEKNIHIQATDGITWKSTNPVDCIILDAPCSATGVIRRHPDIKLLRKSEDIQKIIELQSQILANMWDNLKTGGKLVYITCSLLKAENEEQIKKFVLSTPNAKEIKIKSDWGIEQEYGRQLLPINHLGGDGFFYCVLEKQ